jgi:hypothetical protein
MTPSISHARLLGLLGLLLGLMPGPALAGDGEALWARTVSLAGAAEGLAPGSVHTRTETLDSEGEVQGAEEVWVTMSVGEDGAMIPTIERAEVDGVDTTDQARRQGKKREGRSFELGAESSPFLPDNQERVTAVPRETVEEVDGHHCRGFDLTVTTGKTTATGTVWIDVFTATPWRYEFRADPMPATVREMEMALTYRPQHNGGWVRERLVVEGIGGAGMSQKRFRVTISFSDHFTVQ